MMGTLMKERQREAEGDARKERRERPQGEGHMKKQAGIRGCCDARGTRGAMRSQKRQGRILSRSPQREPGPASLDSRLPKL